VNRGFGKLGIDALETHGNMYLPFSDATASFLKRQSPHLYNT
jgi:hypothetical protein